MFDLQADWGADVLISLVEPESQVLLTIWMRCVHPLPWDMQKSQHDKLMGNILINVLYG